VIEVSELAANALAQSLRMSGVEPERAFRLTKQEDVFALAIDSPAQEDRVVEHDGTVVLMVDQDTEEEVGEVLIDVENRPNGPQLLMRSKTPQH
jgi:transcription elongation GreA/GreB family factor